MRKMLHGTILLLACLCGASAGARAGVVSQYVEGTVAAPSTIDTYGLFGPAGADLTGRTITVFMQYNGSRSQFPNEYYCALTCLEFGTAAKKDNLPGAALIVVDLKQVRHVVVPRRTAYVTFNFDYGTPGIYTDLGAGIDDTLPGGAWVLLAYPPSISFGTTLSPKNNPVSSAALTSPGPGTVAFITNAGIERFSFLIDKATR